MSQRADAVPQNKAGSPYVCSACGTHFPHADVPPTSCPLCEDERGAVPPSGQAWTTHDELRRSHRTTTREHEAGLLGIGVDPFFLPGQRALLVRTAEGNVLWDCIPIVDDQGIEAVRAQGDETDAKIREQFPIFLSPEAMGRG